MLGRFLDDSYAPAVRRDVTTATLSRLAANACYRYSAPFLATIADGLGVTLSEIGIAVAVTELIGLSAPLVGRRVDRLPHRTSMLGALVGVGAGSIVAASSTGVPMFVAGLIVLSIAKITFDVALGAWIASHVPYERRGRVVGLIETSWALGLLAGVSTMGAVAALSNWRWGFVAGAAMVAVAAFAITVRLGEERSSGAVGQEPRHAHPATPRSSNPLRLGARAKWIVAGMFGLMAASQTLFVTFGAWLEDDYGFGAGFLAAASFGLGALELVASSTAAARTDKWGKERSVLLGAGVMIPTGLLLAVANGVVVPGLILLGIFIAGFEFAIVSALSMGSQLVPGAPARGLGAVIAAGTTGRAVATVPTTWLYERQGFWASALLGVGFAVLTMAAITVARTTPADATDRSRVGTRP